MKKGDKYILTTMDEKQRERLNLNQMYIIYNIDVMPSGAKAIFVLIPSSIRNYPLGWMEKDFHKYFTPYSEEPTNEEKLEQIINKLK